MKALGRGLLAATCCLIQLVLGEAKAADPFVPDNTVSCTSAVTRGAQRALETHMEKLKLDIQNEDFNLTRELYKAREKGESAVGLETQQRLKAATDRYKLQGALGAKTAELQAFAAKKYKCRLELFYFVP
jgi:hypothetical protein